MATSGLFGGGGRLSNLFPDLGGASSLEPFQQLVQLMLQDPSGAAQLFASKGAQPFDLGPSLTDTRVDATQDVARPGVAPPVQDNKQVADILKALSAIEAPQAPTPRPLPSFPGNTSIPAPRGGPDADVMAQLIQLLQGQGPQAPGIPTLGQLIGR